MSRIKNTLGVEAQQQANAAANARWSRQWEDDLKTVVGTSAGMRLLGRLIFDTCNVMVSAEKPTNAEIYMISGRRQIGESLLSTLESIAPAETRRMVDDWFRDRFERRTEIERAGSTRPLATETGDIEDDP